MAGIDKQNFISTILILAPGFLPILKSFFPKCRFVSKWKPFFIFYAFFKHFCLEAAGSNHHGAFLIVLKRLIKLHYKEQGFRKYNIKITTSQPLLVNFIKPHKSRLPKILLRKWLLRSVDTLLKRSLKHSFMRTKTELKEKNQTSSMPSNDFYLSDYCAAEDNGHKSYTH